MRKKTIYLIFACLSIFILVLWVNWTNQNNWHNFFVAPPHHEGVLLQKPGPLDRTAAINQKISGNSAYKEQKLHFFLEDMVTHMQTDLAKQEILIEEKKIQTPKKLCKHSKPQQNLHKQNLHKNSKPQQTKEDFFPAAYQNNKRKIRSQHKSHFIVGYVAGKQILKHGRSIKIAVQEPFVYQGQKIPKGAFLYGVVAFGKERILSQLETAVFGKNTVAIQMALYDSDYTLGLLAEDLLPFMENSKDRLLHKAVGSSRNVWLRELSNTTVDAIKSIKSDKKVILENKRKVLLKPIKI